MTTTLRLGGRPKTARRDPGSLRPWQIGAIIQAVNLDPTLSDLLDVMQMILATALVPAVVQGLRWEDVRFEDRCLMVRSASLHTLSISVPAPVMRRLHARRLRHPDDEHIFSFDCLREAEQKVRELSHKILGRELTLEDLRAAKLNGWGRYNPKDLL